MDRIAEELVRLASQINREAMLPKNPHKKEEVYADYDEDTDMWCVFGSDSGFVYASYGSESRAEREADRLNKKWGF
jgi:hypothetical protein